MNGQQSCITVPLTLLITKVAVLVRIKNYFSAITVDISIQKFVLITNCLWKLFTSVVWQEYLALEGFKVRKRQKGHLTIHSEQIAVWPCRGPICGKQPHALGWADSAPLLPTSYLYDRHELRLNVYQSPATGP